MRLRGVSAVLAVVLATAGLAAAQSDPCQMHVAHTGPHERVSCGMTRLGALDVSDSAGLGQIAVHGDLAAVVQRDEGLVALVDVADPAAPRLLGRYDGNTGHAELDHPLDGDVAFSWDGRYLFYARQTSEFSYEGLHAVDVADPTQPALAHYVPAGGTFRVGYHRTAAGVEHVVTLDAITGLQVFRFDRTAAGALLVPLHVDALPALKVGGPASAGVHVDPHDPQLGVPLLYVATGRTGLEVFDFSDPARPVLLGAWSGAGLAAVEVDATESGRTVYAATEYWFSPQTEPRIVRLDASELGDIRESGRFSPASPAYPAGFDWRLQGMDLADGALVVAHSHGGVGVLDPASLDGPPSATTTDLGEGNGHGAFRRVAPYAMDVAVAGGVVFVTDASTGTLSTFALADDA